VAVTEDGSLCDSEECGLDAAVLQGWSWRWLIEVTVMVESTLLDW
jgi:hypothetical protein